MVGGDFWILEPHKTFSAESTFFSSIGGSYEFRLSHDHGYKEAWLSLVFPSLYELECEYAELAIRTDDLESFGSWSHLQRRNVRRELSDGHGWSRPTEIEGSFSVLQRCSEDAAWLWNESIWDSDSGP